MTVKELIEELQYYAQELGTDEAEVVVSTAGVTNDMEPTVGCSQHQVVLLA